MLGNKAAKKGLFLNSDPSSRQKNVSVSDEKTVLLSRSPVSGSRFELKYHINESTATGIVQYISSYMHLDKYCILRLNGCYPIVSLYLDSPDLHLCRESTTGIKNRFKLRIRSYTDDPAYPRFLEIKRRLNSIIVKSRMRIMDNDIKTLFTSRFVPGQSNITEELAVNQFRLYFDSIRARPVVLIRYMRQAYEDDFHNRLRITFDRQLAYKITNLPEVKLGGNGWRRHSYTVGGVVMEIKFNGHYPLWLNRMVRHFDLRQVSISKYASSVQDSCLLEFCAPEIGTL